MIQIPRTNRDEYTCLTKDIEKSGTDESSGLTQRTNDTEHSIKVNTKFNRQYSMLIYLLG